MKTALNPATKRSAKRTSTNQSLQIDPKYLPDLATVTVTDTTVSCSFEDSRTVSFPIAWSQKLMQATPLQRQSFEFNAHFIFWDDIDEIIGVRNILFGKQLRWQ